MHHLNAQADANFSFVVGNNFGKISNDSYKTILSYNSKSETIDFEYTWYEESNDFRIFTEKGKYKFNGTSFIEMETNKKYLDIKN